MTESPQLPHPFKHGASYRVVSDFSYYGFAFTRGEVLIFKHDGYNRYDEGTVYEFLSSEGVRKDWILYDGESLDVAWRYFERV